jgi:hypothetical protein
MIPKGNYEVSRDGRPGLEIKPKSFRFRGEDNKGNDANAHFTKLRHEIAIH